MAQGTNGGPTPVSSASPSSRAQTLAWGAPAAAKPAMHPIHDAVTSVGETLASSPVEAFDETMAAPSAGPQSLPIAAPETRTTVLPRVELIGNVPTLVHDRRVRYQQGKRLGEGGLGEVISVDDQDIGRTAAMKRLRPEVTSPAAVARFVDEIRTVGRLEHPNIVPIHDVGVDEKGEYYFVMKYVDGETLESIIEKLAAGDAEYHRRYGFEQRVQIFRSLLEAVAFAHAKGIVHRDIKPANVMIGRYGEVVLMDWGIAKQASGEASPASMLAPASETPLGNERARGFETQTGSLIGTPAYMAPEQARGEPCDFRSDIYSLSALFYELLTHRHYLGERATLSDILEGVGTHNPPMAGLVKSAHQEPVPAELAWYVKDGLNKDPAKRFSSAQEMIDRLNRRAAGDFPIQCPCTLAKRVTGATGRFVDRKPALGILMFLACVAMFVMLVIRAA